MSFKGQKKINLKSSDVQMAIAKLFEIMQYIGRKYIDSRKKILYEKNLYVILYVLSKITREGRF